MLENNVPNLDSMDADELWNWGISRTCKTRLLAAEIFPDKPRGYVRTMNSLAAYAINKATAIRCRSRGSIVDAFLYENICDRIYGRLPDYAKW